MLRFSAYIPVPARRRFFVSRKQKRRRRSGLANTGKQRKERCMDTRIAVTAIIVEDRSKSGELNRLLHDYGEYIVGRMGVPYREKGVSEIPSLTGGYPGVLQTGIRSGIPDFCPPGRRRRILYPGTHGKNHKDSERNLSGLCSDSFYRREG